MANKVGGYLEVGANDQGEVVINHPDLEPDEKGCGSIVFSPKQARNLAMLLLKHANEAEKLNVTVTLNDNLHRGDGGGEAEE